MSSGSADQGNGQMRSLDHIWPFCVFVFGIPVNKIPWFNALMRSLICFSEAAFQKNAGIDKERLLFWQAICNSVIPSRQPNYF
jgi:hypothetical protein